MDKYRRLRARVASSPDHADDVLLVPAAATDDELLLCHASRYLDAVKTGTLSDQEIRRIGFPWSEKMVQRSRRSTGATIAAARAAITDGIACNLAGGTHHAFADAGEGYCVFNDAAVAIRTLQRDRLIRRACVIDLDVHQGNGTASILAGDPSTFTFSLHGEKNFPLRKMPSDLDISLPDGSGDETYLGALQDALAKLDQACETGPAFDLVIYLAGADPYREDRLGRLKLSKRGLARRDGAVFNWAQQRGYPVAVTMAGGYAESIDDIVDIHANTLKLAKEVTLRRDGTL
tara:strand:+ start:30415 stop:31284 length:870 start_codon:yes stop_codon:yes gene_type:complete